MNTGDGAGILIQIPDKFLRKEAGRLGISLPPEGRYGVGAVFLPREGALETAWDSCTGDEMLVVEFGLEREFMLPLASGKLDPFIGIIGALFGVTLLLTLIQFQFLERRVSYER